MTTNTENKAAPSRTTQAAEMGQICWGQISISTKMACGARDVYVDDGGEYCLVFRVSLGRGRGRGRGPHKICVHYNGGLDLYEVKLLGIVTGRDGFISVKTLEEAEMVYAEDLSEIIYKMCNK